MSYGHGGGPGCGCGAGVSESGQPWAIQCARHKPSSHDLDRCMCADCDRRRDERYRAQKGASKEGAR